MVTLRKIVFFTTFFLTTFVLIRPVQAADHNLSCALCPEKFGCPGSSGTRLTSGEFFQCQPTGDGYIWYKNDGHSTYEQFRASSDNVYHVYDVPWSTESGPVTCDDSGKIAAGVRFNDYPNGDRGITWINLSGNSVSQSGYVIGQSLDQLGSGNYCDTQFSGSITHGMVLDYHGCIKFPNGIVSIDTYVFKITSGGGVGENFYYNGPAGSKNKGWIGFDRGTNGSGNYPQDPIDDPASAPPDCKEITYTTAPYNPQQGGTSYFCNLGESGDLSSRPVPCQDCNQTSRMVSDCATTFSINGSVSFERGDGDFCGSGAWPWVLESWEGLVTVDARDTRIPFVGKKDEEDERKWLADYFEGTGIYYAPPYDYTNPADLARVLNEGGIWRKLTPPDIQDLLKRNMLTRVLASQAGFLYEGVVRDYNLSYKGFSGQVSDFVYHLPPKRYVDDYDDLYQVWKNSDGGKWFNLWTAMPMFSREDTAGIVMPYLGRKPYDTFAFQPPPESTIEKVPHVARLYEVTTAINQLLLPKVKQAQNPTITNIFTSQINQKPVLASLSNTNNPILASAESTNQVDNNPTQDKPSTQPYILAQSGGSGIEVSPRASYDGSQVTVYVDLISKGGCDGHFYFYVDGGERLVNQCCLMSHGVFQVNPEWNGSPFPLGEGQKVSHTYSATINASNGEGCAGTSDTVTCDFTILGGQLQSNCTGVTLPPQDVCGPLPEQGVEGCDKPADTGDGDNICCGPINIDFTGYDNIENVWWTECFPCEYDYSFFPPKLLTPDCNACHDIKTVGVSRRVGVSLAHPYLKEIWNNSSDVLTGFWNIFRPDPLPTFEPVPAKDQIRYSFTPGSADPTVGNFYYPYLGGVQRTKEWVINELHQPDSP